MKTVLFSLLALSLSGAAVAADPNALFAAARAKHESAAKHRAEADKLEDQEAALRKQAGQEDLQGRILTAQALAAMKANANQIKANNLRQQAHKLDGQAAILRAAAKRHSSAAADDRQDAQEILKAMAVLKDQPAVQAQLKDDAARENASAASHEAQAKTLNGQAETLEKKADQLEAEANKLDPKPGIKMVKMIRRH